MSAKISKPKVASIIFAALAVLFCSSGATIGQTKTKATAKLATAKPQALSESEKQHLQYILSNTSPVVPHKLNLADPEQYAYVMDTLRRFGRTEKSNPQLFSMLAKARNGTAGPPKLMTTADVVEGSGATLGGVNYTPTFVLDSSQAKYQANSFSSYPPGQIPSNTQVLVSLIDKDHNTVLGSNSANKYNTTNVQVPVTVPAPQDHSDIIANTLFLIAPANGGPPVAYNVVLEDRVGVSQACQQSPNYSPVLGTNQQCQTNAATTCVNNGTITKQIKVCYGNRIQSDCDYGCQGSSNPPNIIFPIQGSVNLGQTPATPLTGSLYIVLNLAPSGGCQLVATNNATGSLTGVISVNSNVASWNFPPAQFPNVNCLQTSANGKLLNYSFQLYLLTSTGTVGATFTSDASQFNLPNTFPVPQMSVLVGCLPAGVQIRMADGSERAVETFTGKGEIVRSPHLDAAAVTATTWGSEDHPMVVIRDSLGHRLTLTEGHPVLTTRGPIMASKLKVGDVVLTETGNAALVSVERLAHQEPVPIYNLTIGTEKQAADGRTTFYADGILVGDQQMQQDLAVKEATPRVLSQMEILRTLPVAWRQDYVNSLRHD